MSRPHLGKRIFISPTLPATNTAAGFEALDDFDEAKGWQTLPQLGFTHATIDIPDGPSGITRGSKGVGSGIESSMSFRLIAGDDGQELLQALADGGGQSSVGCIKIVSASGTLDSEGVPAIVTGDRVQYAQGFFHSYAEVQGDTTTFEGFSVSFRQNGLTITDEEPA
jgi:hypothetical protein